MTDNQITGPEDTAAYISRFDQRCRLEALERENRELLHRLQNYPALVLSVISLTAESSESVEHFRGALEGRIRAISVGASIDREADGNCSLERLVKAALAPFCRADQFTAVGPSVRLLRTHAEDFTLILHELATNAVKHGALSNRGALNCPSGRVRVTWSVRTMKNAPARLRLQWLERGGPAVNPTPRRGFGTTILCDGGKAITNDDARLIFEPAGLRYVVTTSLDRDASWASRSAKPKHPRMAMRPVAQ
ncbi:sensor histidine kinase [Bosea sp. BK604]|uniref:sensor histidine kinase n=1 Tax=Bosea sp. BK604 TaxID=2512180 RepID=UPI0014053505|nr:sensor histidine kinase [Bosea sp. BK604]